VQLPGGGPPALLTRMSACPPRASSTAARPDSVVISPATGVTLTPYFPAISSAVRASTSALRALMTRSTPASASASAQPRPSPFDAAQTSPRLPLIPRSIPASFALRSIVPRAEDGAADTDMGGALGDGGFIIAAHAHGQARQAMRLGHAAQGAEMRHRVRLLGRDAHQPVNRQVHAQAVAQETVQILGQHARLLRLVAGIHLHEKLRTGGAALHGPGQLLRQRGPVQRVD